MEGVYEQLSSRDYKDVLKYFVELSAVPRGSGHNEKISEYLVNFAKEHQLKYVQDEELNVIIYKEATKGYENHTPVVLQGHMDMVCLKADDSNHDFLTQGLELVVEGDVIRANKTTLGGDDGIALAYGLALLSDETLEHPALEILITTDEETGMDGAKALDPNHIKGRCMINVDSEEEDTVLVGCAGGLRFYSELPLSYTEKEGKKVKLVVRGLKGGHSGAEIHNNRTNATILMARAIMELKEQCDFLLCDLKGGDKDNAIPSFAQAEAIVANEDADTFASYVKEIEEKYQKELAASEPNVRLECQVLGEEKAKVIHPSSMMKMLFALLQAPNGVQVMSSEMSGLVESSLNLGIFAIEEEMAIFHYSVRSGKKSYKHFISDKLSFLFGFLGAEFECGSEYPAWEYKKDSKLRDLFLKVYKEQYGKEAKVMSIHAGLECGLISEKIPDMDIISIGPNMKDIHTPMEQLDIPSTIRVYQTIEKLLQLMK